MTTILLLNRNSKMSHTNHSIILYKLLKKVGCSIVIITYFYVKHMFII